MQQALRETCSMLACQKTISYIQLRHMQGTRYERACAVHHWASWIRSGWATLRKDPCLLQMHQAQAGSGQRWMSHLLPTPPPHPGTCIFLKWDRTVLATGSQIAKIHFFALGGAGHHAFQMHQSCEAVSRALRLCTAQCTQQGTEQDKVLERILVLDNTSWRVCSTERGTCRRTFCFGRGA